MGSAPSVTDLLREWRAGRSDAPERLFPLVYDERRRGARRALRGARTGHTLHPTDLVNEVCVRMLGRTASVSYEASRTRASGTRNTPLRRSTRGGTCTPPHECDLHVALRPEREPGGPPPRKPASSREARGRVVETTARSGPPARSRISAPASRGSRSFHSETTAAGREVGGLPEREAERRQEGGGDRRGGPAGHACRAFDGQLGEVEPPEEEASAERNGDCVDGEEVDRAESQPRRRRSGTRIASGVTWQSDAESLPGCERPKAAHESGWGSSERADLLHLQTRIAGQELSQGPEDGRIDDGPIRLRILASIPERDPDRSVPVPEHESPAPAKAGHVLQERQDRACAEHVEPRPGIRLQRQEEASLDQECRPRLRMGSPMRASYPGPYRVSM